MEFKESRDNDVDYLLLKKEILMKIYYTIF